MKKHGLWIVVIGILLGVGCCTVISARNYVEDMPVVTLVNSVPNSLHKSLKVMAGMYYQDTEVIQVPVGCRIEAVFAKLGDNLESGDAILQLKEADLQIQYLQKKIQKEGLERTVEAGGTQGELAYWQLQNLDETLTYMEQLIEAGCIVSTKNACILIGQGYEAGDTTTDSALIEIALPERGCYLEWTISAEDYEKYKGTVVIQGQKVSLSWERPEFKKGVYTYRSELPELTECVHGELVEVELLYTSQEYRAALPKSCIWYDNDGSTYIYQVFTRTRNFGEESYVRKIGVTIQEQDSINVVVDASLKGVVERSSMKLADMMSVVVIED